MNSVFIIAECGGAVKRKFAANAKFFLVVAQRT